MKRFDGVSIIVPCYNVEKYLEQCVESLVNQTVDNYEVLLIDDGSTDQTPELCDQFEKKYKDKIKAYHKKNGGLCDARNYGIKKAKGKYLMFVDSDGKRKKDLMSLRLMRLKSMMEQKKVITVVILMEPIKRKKHSCFILPIHLSHGQDFMITSCSNMRCIPILIFGMKILRPHPSYFLMPKIYVILKKIYITIVKEKDRFLMKQRILKY